MNYYIYVLYNLQSGRTYVGITKNLKRRLMQHKNSKLSHRNCLFNCIFVEIFINRMDAEKRETYLKSSKGRFTMKAMLKNTMRP